MRHHNAVLTTILVATLCILGQSHSAHAAIVWDGDVGPTDPGTLDWTDLGDVYIGQTGPGTVTVDGNSSVEADSTVLGDESGGDGTLTVSGPNARWYNTQNLLRVGNLGSGTLNIENGAAVYAHGWLSADVGSRQGSTGVVTVTGPGSAFLTIDLSVGFRGDGAVYISDGGLVATGHLRGGVEGSQGDSIYMRTGGMLAIRREADESIDRFQAAAYGADIFYWDDSISDWSHISNATEGVDFTLTYIGDRPYTDFYDIGDRPNTDFYDIDGRLYTDFYNIDDWLNGSTILTVGTVPSSVVPEPSSAAIFALLGTIGLVGHRFRRRRA